MIVNFDTVIINIAFAIAKMGEKQRKDGRRATARWLQGEERKRDPSVDFNFDQGFAVRIETERLPD